jgi:acyl-CoA thioesterase
MRRDDRPQACRSAAKPLSLNRTFSAQDNPLDSKPDPQNLAEACARAMWERDAASQGLGMAVQRVAPGEAVVAMTVRADMVNGHDICHGGFVFLLADSAFAYACNGYDVNTVAASCDISFVRAAHRGDRLTAIARETWREGRNGIYDISVSDQSGAVIAQFRGKSRTVGGSVIAGK